jgi:myosin V
VPPLFDLPHWQTKDVEISAEALQKGSDPSLPPLMNPTMLEASDDLTNLSHLNEPAGMKQTH